MAINWSMQWDSVVTQLFYESCKDKPQMAGLTSHKHVVLTSKMAMSCRPFENGWWFPLLQWKFSGKVIIMLMQTSNTDIVWVNYNDLTATSLESWFIRGIIPKWP